MIRLKTAKRASKIREIAGFTKRYKVAIILQVQERICLLANRATNKRSVRFRSVARPDLREYHVGYVDCDLRGSEFLDVNAVHSRRHEHGNSGDRFHHERHRDSRSL